MGSFGKCKICGDKIFYSPENVANLAVHLIDKHPDHKFGHFSLIYRDRASKKCTCGCDCNCNVGSTSKAKKKGMRNKYKTTVESWKSAQNPHTCVNCGKTSIPIMRRQRNKLAKSHLGSLILLGCWPLCFLPFILGGSDLMYLYCKECGHFIGMFDRKCSQNSEALCQLPKRDKNPQMCGCE